MYFETDRIKRILEELKDQIYTEKLNITEIRMKACVYGDYSLLNEDSADWDKFNPGEKWGGKDLHCWFKLKVRIPEKLENKAVMFEVKTGTEDDWDALNPQFLVYLNGQPVQGLDVNHREILLTDNAAADSCYELALYAYSGVKDRKVDFIPTLAAYNKTVEKLYYDIKVPLEVAVLLEKEDKHRYDILNYLTNAVNLLDLRKPLSKMYFDSVNVAIEYLAVDFYGSYCHESDIIETCIGHTHIDVAWLWTLAQTREKTARSFSTVLNFMKQYPDYKFMSSQPQLYQYLKEDHPELYQQVKMRVKEGRWETEGAMWLEADCNLTSGESLVRQIIYGKRFFKEEFDVDSRILWLPDVFGYSAALPQILRKSGVDYFMTTKISWNEYNKMPYDTFMWRGIDGSEVFTHFVTTRDYEKNGEIVTWTTYNGDTTPLQVMGCWQRYQHKNMNNEVLNCFGYGDGGGGPTREMLENVMRLEKGIPGAPTVKIGTALDFFKRLEKRVSGHRHMPKWVGELYLEYHRGTYTSMARNKKYNRKTEFLNLDAELFSSMNTIYDKNFKYPKETLRDCWETTLLNQFHDIIPGSSIKEVYEDSRRDYQRVAEEGKTIVDNALSNLVSQMELDCTSVVVFNTLGFERSDLVTVPLPEGYTAVQIFDGEIELPSQITDSGDVIFYAINIPSKGYKSFEIRKADSSKTYEDFGTVGTSEIVTPFFELKLNEKGHLTSIFDKVQQREVLKNGECGNVLQAFEDKPHNFDAWDINIYYSEKMWVIDDLSAIKVVEDGPVRKTLEIKRKFLESEITQRISVYRDIPRVDFANHIDWKEEQILVKAAFPVEVNTSKATYEIQYGNVERPTHWNTSWDYARFEVCAHKWADLSEDKYGVGLLNDCKYGHDIKDGVMRLTLIKSAKDPNEDADREVHEFNYSIYPHSGDFREGRVIPMAYSLNCPLYAVVENKHEGSLAPQKSFVNLDCENVILEVVKMAESTEDLIVRMYECYNRRTKVTCTLAGNVGNISECDLLEKDIQSIEVEGNKFTFEIKPYEIKTFKVMLKK